MAAIEADEGVAADPESSPALFLVAGSEEHPSSTLFLKLTGSELSTPGGEGSTAGLGYAGLLVTLVEVVVG